MNDDPTAQGQSETDSQNTSQEQSETQGAQQFGGVQKRIDELVAKNAEAERRYAEQIQQQQSQISELTRALLEQSRQPVQQQEQIEVNPEIAAQFQALAKPLFNQYEQQLKQQAQVIQQMQYQQVAAQYPTEVQQRANQLMQQWAREGKSGWVMADALVFASYQLGVPPPTVKAQPRNQNGQFAANVLDAAGSHPTPAPQNRSAIPANIEDLPLEKQLEIYSKELGDKPF